MKPSVAPVAAPLRAALYMRVSTGRQAESDLSIPDQRRQGLALPQKWRTAVCAMTQSRSRMPALRSR